MVRVLRPRVLRSGIALIACGVWLWVTSPTRWDESQTFLEWVRGFPLLCGTLVGAGLLCCVRSRTYRPVPLPLGPADEQLDLLRHGVVPTAQFGLLRTALLDAWPDLDTLYQMRSGAMDFEGLVRRLEAVVAHRCESSGVLRAALVDGAVRPPSQWFEAVAALQVASDEADPEQLFTADHRPGSPASAVAMWAVALAWFEAYGGRRFGPSEWERGPCGVGDPIAPAPPGAEELCAAQRRILDMESNLLGEDGAREPRASEFPVELASAYGVIDREVGRASAPVLAIARRPDGSLDARRASAIARLWVAVGGTLEGLVTDPPGVPTEGARRRLALGALRVLELDPGDFVRHGLVPDFRPGRIRRAWRWANTDHSLQLPGADVGWSVRVVDRGEGNPSGPQPRRR